MTTKLTPGKYDNFTGISLIIDSSGRVVLKLPPEDALVVARALRSASLTVSNPDEFVQNGFKEFCLTLSGELEKKVVDGY